MQASKTCAGMPLRIAWGDPAFRVTVVLPDGPLDGARDWSRLKLIQDATCSALREGGVPEFPYIRFATSAELAAENAT